MVKTATEFNEMMVEQGEPFRLVRGQLCSWIMLHLNTSGVEDSADICARTEAEAVHGAACFLAGVFYGRHLEQERFKRIADDAGDALAELS